MSSFISGVISTATAVLGLPVTTAVVVAATTTTAAAVVSEGLIWQPSPTAPVQPYDEDFIDDEPSRLLFIQQPLHKRHLAPQPTSLPLLKRQQVRLYFLLLKPFLLCRDIMVAVERLVGSL